MSGNIAKGTTTPILLAAKSWRWKHVSGPHSVDLKAASDIKVSGNSTANLNTVSFDIEDDLDVHIDFGTMLKQMFTEKSYPELDDNQVFAISDILIDKKGGRLTVVGNTLEKVFN